MTEQSVNSSQRPRILVITPVHHIEGVAALLESFADVTYLPNPAPQDVIRDVTDQDAVFTNPNRSDVFIGQDVMEAGHALKAVCTASTGTNHIDAGCAADRGIRILSLTEQREVITKISSTAEHALALMLAALRHVPQAAESVKRGEWDYTRFIGRQVDHLTVGVVGYGRLGTYFARYVNALGSRVLVYDPYVRVQEPSLAQVELDQLLGETDVISLHVHVTPETTRMVDKSWFERMKPSMVLVNTSRGEIIDEADLIAFLEATPGAMLAADVVSGEVSAKRSSPLIDYARTASNVILTPHLGGMTVEGQQMAYMHAGRQLQRFFDESDPVSPALER
jgi:D-3-phosphoglycerate dehydrogenase